MGRKWETENNSYREKENQGHKKEQTTGVTQDGEIGQEGLSLRVTVPRQGHSRLRVTIPRQGHSGLRVTIPFHTTQMRQDPAWGHTEVRGSARGLK